MALNINRLTIAAALAAGISLIATPVAAAGLPVAGHVQVRNADYDSAAGHGRGNRDWGGRNWGRHRGHDRIDGGDILTGLLILGGIAVIAGAANGSNDREPDYPVTYPEDSRGSQPGSYSSGGRSYESGGMDRAVEMCVGEVERRNADVGEVDGANRGADGWFVSGTTASGSPWTCRIGQDGRVSSVDLGDNARLENYEPDGVMPVNGPVAGQYDDETYARARASMGQVAVR
ncbi:MAG: hypothetical protein WA842_03035 [Croceibacterium sp.]